MSTEKQKEHFKKQRLTNEEFIEKLKNRYPDNSVEPLEKYTLSRVKMKFKCKKCNSIFETRPNTILRPNYTGCPNCGFIKRGITKRSQSKINIESIESKVSELYKNDEYILNKEKSIYINNKKPTIVLTCSRCKNDFSLSYVNLCHMRGCPICNREKRQESKNIMLIKEYLNEKNISFVTEYTFDDCSFKRHLRFDICIHLNNKIYLIEYDGEFHDFGYNSNKDELLKTQERDKFKTDYCIKNNYPLLRLRYNSFDNYKQKINDFLGLV